MRALVALAVGAFLGFAGARLVFGGSPIWLLPWAVTAIVIGVLAASARRAALEGALSGFAIAYVFMLTSYDGSASLASRLVPFVAFGVVGAICAGLLAVAAAALSRSKRRRRHRRVAR